MRAPLTYEDLVAVGGHRDQAGHRQVADTVLEWATEVHPEDEPTTAELLAEAGWQLDLAGDTDAALEVLRRSRLAGPTTPDVRCSIVAVLLADDRVEEARAEADNIRRSRPAVVDCDAMAQVWETAGDLEQALRWTSIGLNRIDLDADDEIDVEASTDLLQTRARVRTAMGLPPE
ncbi:hypothetical protein [Klenkia sp. PcliD-1-E]|uniref:hypothetical protein n=1 Tax=Klenkia sp. PcliD-1-E TaxID=2954492 RepID=UPI0020972567|nr:hypothetical protein [Klenkia sp. PcliD-1-E]MCO7218516.1 hypothetical protein [Klenkia sp. PcliD-1-E]